MVVKIECGNKTNLEFGYQIKKLQSTNYLFNENVIFS